MDKFESIEQLVEYMWDNEHTCVGMIAQSASLPTEKVQDEPAEIIRKMLRSIIYNTIVFSLNMDDDAIERSLRLEETRIISSILHKLSPGGI